MSYTTQPVEDKWAEEIAKATSLEDLRQIIKLSNHVRPSGQERRRRLRLIREKLATLPKVIDIWMRAKPKLVKPKSPCRASRGDVMIPKWHRKRYGQLLAWARITKLRVDSEGLLRGLNW